LRALKTRLEHPHHRRVVARGRKRGSGRVRRLQNGRPSLMPSKVSAWWLGALSSDGRDRGLLCRRCRSIAACPPSRKRHDADRTPALTPRATKYAIPSERSSERSVAHRGVLRGFMGIARRSAQFPKPQRLQPKPSIDRPFRKRGTQESNLALRFWSTAFDQRLQGVAAPGERKVERISTRSPCGVAVTSGLPDRQGHRRRLYLTLEKSGQITVSLDPGAQ
jgi:hypothetical protein